MADDHVALDRDTGHRTRQRTTGARQCWRASASAAAAGLLGGSASGTSDDVSSPGGDLGGASVAAAGGATTALARHIHTDLGTSHVQGAITRHRKMSMSMSTDPASPHACSMLPTPPLTAHISAHDIDPLDRATTHDNAPPSDLSRPAPRFPYLDAYMAKPPADSDKRHPRELVPLDVGFPTKHVAHLVKQEDLDDRLLMAICAVLHSHDNRALCPKEIAEVMFERQWLFNAGLTPFTHISTCIRSHLRRAAYSKPPYYPLLRAHDLTGMIAPHDVPAVGLKAQDRPAVKRGTLWYLDSNALGQGVGADDPFVKCRVSQGIPADGGIGQASHATHGVLGEIGEHEDDEMGRGKRKRRISSAALASWSSEYAYTSSTQPSSAVASPFAVRDRTLSAASSAWGPQSQVHRRSYSMSAVNEASQYTVPKLKLRFTKLEESTIVEDSDGFSSDAAFYRSRNRKKVRPRYRRDQGSTGSSLRSSSDGDSADDSDDLATSSSDDETAMTAPQASVFSSATSSALLAQSLLAASAPTSQLTSSVVPASELHAAITPGSLKLETVDNSLTLPDHTMSHLSISAPSLFSAFPSYRPVPTPQVESESTLFDVHKQQTPESSDAEDCDDTALHGEAFDFEWGAASYATSVGEDERDMVIVPQDKIDLARSREPSLDAVAELVFEEGDKSLLDGSSTPATTPRSPAEDPDAHLASCANVSAMDMTLCKAFEDESSQTSVGVLTELPVATFDRSTSTTSLVNLGHEIGIASTPKLVPVSSIGLADSAVPLPSPLAFDQPPTAIPGRDIATAFGFNRVGDSHVDVNAVRIEHELEAANAADDENDSASDFSEEDNDERDQIVTIKMEDAMFEQELDDENDARVRGARMTNWRNLSRAGSCSGHAHEMASTPSASGSELDCDAAVRLGSASLDILSPIGSPTDAVEWNMGTASEFEPLGHTGDNDLVGPEDMGLDELDLAWPNDDDAAGDEVDEVDERMWQRARAQHKVALLAGAPFAVAETAVETNERKLMSTMNSRRTGRAKPKKRTSSSSVATLRRSRRMSSVGGGPAE
ncbi:hypothetical protein OIV83_001780 [Microbotryomycetes sp. JL201]|nr:hypothetical protein OIV83_001780 [Microbotryomycetes sp. JL201]